MRGAEQDERFKEDHLPAVYKTFELLDGKVKRLELIGGEPLDYPYINEIIDAGNKSSIERLVLITTGINKTKLAEILKLANPAKWGFVLLWICYQLKPMVFGG